MHNPRIKHTTCDIS